MHVSGWRIRFLVFAVKVDGNYDGSNPPDANPGFSGYSGYASRDQADDDCNAPKSGILLCHIFLSRVVIISDL